MAAVHAEVVEQDEGCDIKTVKSNNFLSFIFCDCDTIYRCVRNIQENPMSERERYRYDSKEEVNAVSAAAGKCATLYSPHVKSFFAPYSFCHIYLASL